MNYYLTCVKARDNNPPETRELFRYIHPQELVFQTHNFINISAVVKSNWEFGECSGVLKR